MYLSTILVIVVCSLSTASYVFIKHFRNVSFKLFVNMLQTVIKRDISWFLKTPPSRIISIMVADFNEID